MPDARIDSVQARRGTAVIVAGTLVSGLSVLVYEIIAARALGADDFAAIGSQWTVGFIVLTVLMLPIELFVTRSLVLSGGRPQPVIDNRFLIAGVLGAGILLGGAFTALTIDQLFNGEAVFVLIMVTLLTSRSLLVIARGFIAGRRRFTAYGLAVGLEGLTLVVGAIGAWSLLPTEPGFGWAMAVAPLSVLALRPFKAATPTDALEETASPGQFLGWLLAATAAAQLILAGGPVVVGLIGGSAVAVSIFFTTFTLFRFPITSAYNLVARVLPDFTQMAADHREADLRRWSRRLVVGGLGLAALGFAAAYVVGPLVIELIYGAGFRPDAAVAALGGAGVGAGLSALFVHQIFVARGTTRALAAGWAIALVVAAVTVALWPGAPLIRVAAGFAFGEVAALLILGWLEGISPPRWTPN